MNNIKAKEIKELMELMKDNDVEELIIRSGKNSVEIRKKGAFVQASSQLIAQPAPIQTFQTQTLQEDSKTSGSKSESDVKESDDYHEIKAPLVGTFYRAPAPDKDPFVKIGDEVNPGQTLCIVEAMKNMNEIESDVKGIIKEICVENAQMVEFGQVLFKIEVTR